jgi:predicted RNA-binding protein with PIN domain
MALVRILVDGYSLLHNWPGLAPGRARHSAAARNELIRRLTCYQDATGTPITVFFDGSSPPDGKATAVDSSVVEVLYSRQGQTADQMIERAAHRFGPYGEVLAVTDDHAATRSLAWAAARPVAGTSSRWSKMPWRTWKMILNITTGESGTASGGGSSEPRQRH